MPQINNETKNSQSLKRLVKQLKELHNFDITLDGKIEDWIDAKTLTPIIEMAEGVSENKLMKEMPRYLKAKTLGENFAREITS